MMLVEVCSLQEREKLKLRESTKVPTAECHEAGQHWQGRGGAFLIAGVQSSPAGEWGKAAVKREGSGWWYKVNSS